MINQEKKKEENSSKTAVFDSTRVMEAKYQAENLPKDICEYHQNRRAKTQCTKCKSYICPDCEITVRSKKTLNGKTRICPRCNVIRLEKNSRVDRQVVFFLLFTIFGLGPFLFYEIYIFLVNLCILIFVCAFSSVFSDKIIIQKKMALFEDERENGKFSSKTLQSEEIPIIKQRRLFYP
jgi:B-box zinc finger